MVCLYCGGPTQIINSRRKQRNNQVWRRRRCLACQAVFTTTETIELETTLAVNKNGHLEPFLRDLLLKDLITYLKHREDVYTSAGEVLNTIVQQLLVLPSKPQFSTRDISRVSGQILKRFDRRAYLRWYAEHSSSQESV